VDEAEFAISSQVLLSRNYLFLSIKGAESELGVHF